MRKIAFIFVFSVILLSCEKDKQLIKENTDIPLLAAKVVSGELYCVYDYNEANLMIAEKTKFHYTRHSYNESNMLTSSEFYVDMALFSSSSDVIEAANKRTEWVDPSNTEKSLTIEFEYDHNGQLTRTTYNRPSVTNTEISEFAWENGRISRKTMYWNSVVSGYIDYLYDTKGNLVKQEKYRVPDTGIPELSTTTVFEFDSMNNPYQSFKRLMNPGINTNPNNITKETYTLHFEVDQWTQRVQVTEYHYEYNQEGYPVKVNGDLEYVYK